MSSSVETTSATPPDDQQAGSGAEAPPPASESEAFQAAFEATNIIPDGGDTKLLGAIELVYGGADGEGGMHPTEANWLVTNFGEPDENGVLQISQEKMGELVDLGLVEVTDGGDFALTELGKETMSAMEAHDGTGHANGAGDNKIGGAEWVGRSDASEEDADVQEFKQVEAAIGNGDGYLDVPETAYLIDIGVAVYDEETGLLSFDPSVQTSLDDVNGLESDNGPTILGFMLEADGADGSERDGAVSATEVEAATDGEITADQWMQLDQISGGDGSGDMDATQVDKLVKYGVLVEDAEGNLILSEQGIELAKEPTIDPSTMSDEEKLAYAQSEDATAADLMLLANDPDASPELLTAIAENPNTPAMVLVSVASHENADEGVINAVDTAANDPARAGEPGISTAQDAATANGNRVASDGAEEEIASPGVTLPNGEKPIIDPETLEQYNNLDDDPNISEDEFVNYATAELGLSEADARELFKEINTRGEEDAGSLTEEQQIGVEEHGYSYHIAPTEVSIYNRAAGEYNESLSEAEADTWVDASGSEWTQTTTDDGQDAWVLTSASDDSKYVEGTIKLDTGGTPANGELVQGGLTDGDTWVDASGSEWAQTTTDDGQDAWVLTSASEDSKYVEGTIKLDTGGTPANGELIQGGLTDGDTWVDASGSEWTQTTTDDGQDAWELTSASEDSKYVEGTIKLDTGGTPANGELIQGGLTDGDTWIGGTGSEWTKITTEDGQDAWELTSASDDSKYVEGTIKLDTGGTPANGELIQGGLTDGDTWVGGTGSEWTKTEHDGQDAWVLTTPSENSKYLEGTVILDNGGTPANGEVVDGDGGLNPNYVPPA